MLEHTKRFQVDTMSQDTILGSCTVLEHVSCGTCDIKEIEAAPEKFTSHGLSKTLGASGHHNIQGRMRRSPDALHAHAIQGRIDST